MDSHANRTWFLGNWQHITQQQECWLTEKTKINLGGWQCMLLTSLYPHWSLIRLFRWDESLMLDVLELERVQYLVINDSSQVAYTMETCWVTGTLCVFSHELPFLLVHENMAWGYTLHLYVCEACSHVCMYSYVCGCFHVHAQVHMQIGARGWYSIFFLMIIYWGRIAC